MSNKLSFGFKKGITKTENKAEIKKVEQDLTKNQTPINLSLMEDEFDANTFEFEDHYDSEETYLKWMGLKNQSLEDFYQNQPKFPA